MNADYGKWEMLWFQFYDSAIKRTRGLACASPHLLRFNSTIVRLKEECRVEQDFRLVSFNSTIVRLKVR